LERIKSNPGSCDAAIVTSEEKIVELVKLGYDCQSVGTSRWIMRKQISP